MHKMLHTKADVERLYVPRKDGGASLINLETAFKTAAIGFDHYLKHKEGQYTKRVLEHEKSKAKNSISKNVTKFKKKTKCQRLRIEGIYSPPKMPKTLKMCLSPR